MRMSHTLAGAASVAILVTAAIGVAAWRAPTPDHPLMRAAPIGLAATPPLLGPDTAIPWLPMIVPADDSKCYDALGNVSRRCKVLDKEVRGTWKAVHAGMPPLSMLFGGDPSPPPPPAVPAPMPQPVAPWQLPTADQVIFCCAPAVLSIPPQAQASPR